MGAVVPLRDQDRVRTKVAQLSGSGLPERALHLGAESALRQQLPLRDAIVLREARHFIPSTDAVRAWVTARRSLRRVLHRTSYVFWIKPLRPVGADGTTLLLAAPRDVAAWVQRRYAPVIREALEGTPYTEIEFVKEDAPCQ